MPMGPLILTDLVGLDTAVYAGKVVAKAYPDRTVTSPILEEMLKASPGDKKSLDEVLADRQEGRSHSPTRPRWRSSPSTRPAIARSIRKRSPTGSSCPCFWRRRACWRKEIVREPADVDMGLILGIGFPPFQGGILRWCDSLGRGAVVEKLAKYSHLGKRFEPTESLLRAGKDG